MEDTTVKFEEFKEKEIPEKSFVQYMLTDFIMAPFEQAKPWRRNALEEWTAIIRQPSGFMQATEITYSRDDEIEVREWPKFKPQTGDVISFYKPISGARVGLMTVAFTMLVFILGSIFAPDRKSAEINPNDSNPKDIPPLDPTATKTSATQDERPMP